jgi:hypothetical protein
MEQQIDIQKLSLEELEKAYLNISFQNMVNTKMLEMVFERIVEKKSEIQCETRKVKPIVLPKFSKSNETKPNENINERTAITSSFFYPEGPRKD